MKGRIISALSDLAQLEGEELQEYKLYQKLKAYFGQENMKFDIAERARMVLNFILSDYSNFSVSTIESFFQRVIRAFSKELNLPLGYEVDMQQEMVLERIIQQTFREIGTDKKLTKVLRRLMERSMEEEKGWKIENKIKELGGEIFKEQFQEQLVQFSEENVKVELEDVMGLEETLWKIRKHFEGQMEEWARLAMRIMGQFNLSAEDFKNKKSGAVGYFFKVTDKKEYEPGKRVRNAVEGRNEWYTAKSELATTIQQAVDEGLQGLMDQMVDFYDQNILSYNSATLVSKNLYSFGVMNDLQRKLIDYRLENNRLIISDTNYLLRQIVSEQDTPFIYEKVGTRYRYYLIDEFQDTSDMQWENLRPLVLEALSRGEGSLIVGDVKQSIYRWRNGNPELLLYKVEAEMDARNQPVENKNLLDNWRTAHQVVEFNNRFFETAVELLKRDFNENEQEAIELAYGQIAQNPRKQELDGLVKIEMLPRTDPHWKEAARDRVLETIRSLRQEKFAPGDICLLVRTNSEAVDISEHLQANGIPVASAESLKLNNHPQVRFLHALLSLLDHEGEGMYQAQVAYAYHLLHKQNKAQQQLTLGFSDGVPDSVFAGKKGADLPKELKGRMALLRQQPVYECLERLIQLFPDILDHNAYVQAFLDQALDYGSRNEASIGGFLTYWEEIKTKPAIPATSSAEAVEVMTVHKAKGLEFPIVIMPFADWDMEPKANSLLWVRPEQAPYDQFGFLPVSYSKKLKESYFERAYSRERLLSYLDNLNLLYVAFTRPKLRLYLFCPEKGRSDGIKKAASVIQKALDEIPLQGQVGTDANNSWMFGKAGAPSSIEESDTNAFFLTGPQRLLASWNQAVRIRYSSNRYLKGSILERSDKIKMGELLHEALSYVIVSGDIPTASQTMIRKGFLSAELQEAFERLLQGVISFEGIAPYFEEHWEVKTEADIILPSRKTLRPDRVNIMDKLAVIIDYKTGHRKDVYTKQVIEYMDALQALGYTETRGIIYYTSLGEIQEV